MKLFALSFAFCLVGCAASPALPVLPDALQVKILALNFELKSAEDVAAPYLAAVKAAEAAAKPAGDEAAKACNPRGGSANVFTLRDHKVVCVAAPVADKAQTKK